eukprot:SAG11_NODE_652_length_7925_cov_3.950166_1_plen_130_part_00
MLGALLILAASVATTTEGAANETTPLPSKRRYCIIGAGAAGLQLGQFMHKNGRDYVTLEKQDRAASFFDRFPRHRKLISINKRYTGRSDPDFNMRHDWNSLCVTPFPLFRPARTRTSLLRLMAPPNLHR